jgi:O-acetyl-ADP-ribose deacetylase (regulator of RNase III)
MPITYHPGEDLLASDAEALVNTVNCVGVMGKGIAKEFREDHPTNFIRYQKACREGRISPGRPFITKNDRLSGCTYIINAPTKDHWRDGSKMEWIISNLNGLKELCAHIPLKSIAIPPMGCGNGGLLWDEVNPLFEQILGKIDTHVKVYAERCVDS